jgi:hypothetical protein
MAGIESIRNVANIMAQKYGANPQFVAAQLAHESANGTSRLAVENHNYGGLTQSTPNGEENKQPDGGNYYRMFGSDEEYADSMYNDFFKYYPEILKAQTIDEYSHILKQNGYYGASETDYTNSLKGWLGKAGQSGGLLGGANAIDSVDGIKTNMVTENPNEKLDMEGVMAIIQQPKRNVASAGEEALREQLVRQAHHKARGAFSSRFYEDSDKAMMNAAVAKAQEEAKLQNANAQLTGAGKLAQMIANSQNNSNRQAYASLGAMVGMNVNPMQTQLMSHNELAKMGLQVQLQRKQQEEQMQRQKEMMMLSAMIHPHGGGSGRGGGGGRGSSGEKRMMSPATNLKYAQEAYKEYTDTLHSIEDVDNLSQQDVNTVNHAMKTLKNKMAMAEDDPYALQVLKDANNDYNYLMRVMPTKQTGAGLDYSVKKDDEE